MHIFEHLALVFAALGIAWMAVIGGKACLCAIMDFDKLIKRLGDG